MFFRYLSVTDIPTSLLDGRPPDARLRHARSQNQCDWRDAG